METKQLKLLMITFYLFWGNLSHSMGEHEAGELCGGWKAGNRTVLDDQVFYECVEKTSKGLPFNEFASRSNNALKICGDKGNNCVFALLKEPSRLAIKVNKKANGRDIASINEKERAPKSIKETGLWKKVLDFFSW